MRSRGFSPAHSTVGAAPDTEVFRGTTPACLTDEGSEHENDWLPQHWPPCWSPPVRLRSPRGRPSPRIRPRIRRRNSRRVTRTTVSSGRSSGPATTPASTRPRAPASGWRSVPYPGPPRVRPSVRRAAEARALEPRWGRTSGAWAERPPAPDMAIPGIAMVTIRRTPRACRVKATQWADRAKELQLSGGRQLVDEGGPENWLGQHHVGTGLACPTGEGLIITREDHDPRAPWGISQDMANHHFA